MRVVFILLMLLTTRAFCDMSQQDKLTKYLSELVSMPTQTADISANDKALHWVKQELLPLGLHFKHEVYNGHPTLIATTQKTKTPEIFLVAHIDVVPATKDLFNPKIVGDKMYGRGVYDMKMAIACYILLLQELQDDLLKLNIGLMLTSDEEVGGMNGVKRLLESGYKPKVALLPDGGFDWNFEEEAKGVMQVKIVAQGKSSHSSRPDLGENAIEILMEAIQKMGCYFEQQEDRYGPTVNIGMIRGGKAVNQVPHLAEANIDIRYPASITRRKIHSALNQIVGKDARLSFEITAEGSAHHVDVEQQPFACFREIAKNKYGIEIGKMRSFGASDARFFSERDIPVLVIAPHGGKIHSEGEWIDLKDLTRFYNVMKNWVLETALLEKV